MTDFCGIYLSNVPFIAKTFLVAALVIALLSAAIGLLKAYQAPPPPPPTAELIRLQSSVSALTPFMEALKGLLETLAKGPPWFAMFLAGLLLFWMAGDAYKNVCSAPSPDRTPSAGQNPVPQGNAGNRSAPGGNTQAPSTR